jgi:hypothetical protein
VAYWRNCNRPRWVIGASNTRQPPAPVQPAADGMQRAGGPSCGMLPNIHVRSISIETLRADPHFAALPPVDDLVLSHPQCYRCLGALAVGRPCMPLWCRLYMCFMSVIRVDRPRAAASLLRGSHCGCRSCLALCGHVHRYVRQDSSMWRALHAGVLTSSTLNGALGVHELSAVAQLGLPKHFVSHGKLLAAAANLCQPQHVPPPPVPLPNLAAAHQLNKCAFCPPPLHIREPSPVASPRPYAERGHDKNQAAMFSVVHLVMERKLVVAHQQGARGFKPCTRRPDCLGPTQLHRPLSTGMRWRRTIRPIKPQCTRSRLRSMRWASAAVQAAAGRRPGVPCSSLQPATPGGAPQPSPLRNEVQLLCLDSRMSSCHQQWPADTTTPLTGPCCSVVMVPAWQNSSLSTRCIMLPV